MKADGYEPLLTGSRWLLLKRPENLSEKQSMKLSELLQYNLKSVRSHLMKEDFQIFGPTRIRLGLASFLMRGVPERCAARSSR